MKRLALLTLSISAVGCTTTKIDDHSYKYIHTTTPPPVNIINNNTIYNKPETQRYRPHQEDEDFLMYQQADPKPQPTLSSYSGRVGVYPSREVVPVSWNVPPQYYPPRYYHHLNSAPSHPYRFAAVTACIPSFR